MFAFIDTQRTRFGVVSLCRCYHVTTPGFYAWLGRDESAHAKQDRVLTTEISRLFALHKERSGSPRIHQALGLAGWCVSRRRVCAPHARGGPAREGRPGLLRESEHPSAVRAPSHRTAAVTSAVLALAAARRPAHGAIFHSAWQ